LRTGADEVPFARDQFFKFAVLTLGRLHFYITSVLTRRLLPSPVGWRNLYPLPGVKSVISFCPVSGALNQEPLQAKT
jgi:hypothetical protein